MARTCTIDAEGNQLYECCYSKCKLDFVKVRKGREPPHICPKCKNVFHGECCGKHTGDEPDQLLCIDCYKDVQVEQRKPRGVSAEQGQNKPQPSATVRSPRLAKTAERINESRKKKKMEEEEQDWKKMPKNKRRKTTKSTGAPCGVLDKLPTIFKGELKKFLQNMNKRHEDVLDLVAKMKLKELEDEQRKERAIAIRQRRAAKKAKRKDERNRKKEANGEPTKTRHKNKLLDEIPDPNFFLKSCDALDIQEWVKAQVDNGRLNDKATLEKIAALKDDDKKGTKAKHWRMITKPLFEEFYPKLFDGNDSDEDDEADDNKADDNKADDNKADDNDSETASEKDFE